MIKQKLTDGFWHEDLALDSLDMAAWKAFSRNMRSYTFDR